MRWAPTHLSVVVNKQFAPVIESASFAPSFLTSSTMNRRGQGPTTKGKGLGMRLSTLTQVVKRDVNIDWGCRGP